MYERTFTFVDEILKVLGLQSVCYAQIVIVKFHLF